MKFCNENFCRARTDYMNATHSSGTHTSSLRASSSEFGVESWGCKLWYLKAGRPVTYLCGSYGWIQKIRRNASDNGNLWSTQRETCSNVTLSTINPIWTGMGLILVLKSEKLVANSLTYDPVFLGIGFCNINIVTNCFSKGLWQWLITVTHMNDGSWVLNTSLNLMSHALSANQFQRVHV
jgi:hypothetical protein